MKKHKIREYSPAWFLTNGMGAGLLGIAGLYCCMLLLVTLANKGVL